MHRRPYGWAEDNLSRYMETAARNRFATFANKKEWFQRLADIDAAFERICAGWRNPPDIEAAWLVLRSHAAFRAACEHSMAGQLMDAHALLRNCLEAAAYGLYMRGNRERAAIWMSRQRSDADRRKTKATFTIGAIKETIRATDAAMATVFDTLYQRTIDFGAHPNDQGVLGSLELTELPEGMRHDFLYLQGDGTNFDLALKTSAQVGVCALELGSLAFPDTFSSTGVKLKLPHLRVGL